MLAICNGMFRSGSTLQYRIARELLERTNSGVAEGFYDTSSVSENMPRLRNWENDDYCHLIKMHDAYPHQNYNCANVRILYIFRDIRDVAASIKMKLRIQGDDLDRMLDDAISVYWQVANRQDVLCQRYEEVHYDLPGAVSEVANYLGVVAESSTLKDVVNDCSLNAVVKEVRKQNMENLVTRCKVLLNKLGFRLQVYDTDSLLHYNHISATKGAEGVWREVLSSDEKRRYNRRYRSWLVRNGYW